MTKVKKSSLIYATKEDNGGSLYLDKLETTSDCFISKSHEALYNTAILKHDQNNKLVLLMNLSKVNNEDYWRKRYQDTYYCNHTQLREGKHAKGSLCRKRWCKICSRIKTAELINGYLEPLTSLQDEDQLYLVTLTAPTCKERELQSQIKSRLKTFTRVKDNLRKRYGIKLNGYRKLECTYNEIEDRYHPHIHLIVQGYSEALKVRELWLNSFKNVSKEKRADIKGQDIQLIQDLSEDKKGIKEVFKYATKGAVNNETQAYAEHVIQKSLKGIRIYQPYGKVRKVKAPKEEKTSKHDIDWSEETTDIYVFDQSQKDWINATDEPLVGVKDIEQIERIKTQGYVKTKSKR